MVRLLSWLVPGGPVLALTAGVWLVWGSGDVLEEVTRGYPWVVFGGSFLLAFLFHRSRVAVAVTALAVMAAVATGGDGGEVAFFFASGLFVLCLAGLAPLKDSGVASFPGALQLGVLAVVLAFGTLFLRVAPGDMAALLSAAPLPGDLTDWSGLPQPLFLATAVAALTTALAAVLRRGPVERGMVWALLAVLPAMGVIREREGTILFLMAAGLILGLSVLEISYAMAYRDDLTGLPARRALMRHLETLGGTYSVAMVDVDHFKKFNDRHGHDVGDQVLKMVASRLARPGGGGRAFRYGGEEFTLLYAGKDRDATLPYLEEVRRSVEEAVFVLRSWPRPRKKPANPRTRKGSRGTKPRELSVTVSIGVADSSGRDGTPDVVLKKADEALYRAKRKGRNQVAK